MEPQSSDSRSSLVLESLVDSGQRHLPQGEQWVSFEPPKIRILWLDSKLKRVVYALEYSSF